MTTNTNRIAGYIVADDVAIYAVGATPEAVVAEYNKDFPGDDSLAVETISRDPRGGKTYVAPASAELLAYVESNPNGGAIAWAHDDNGVAVMLRDDDE